MTNRGNQIHLSCPFVPVMNLRVIPEIRSLILITKMESFFDSNPYFFLIEDFPSKSRNSFLFFRKSSCPASALRFLWIRLPVFVRLRDLSGGWWFLSLLDRILSHKPPWNSPDILPRHQSRWYSKRTPILAGEEKSNFDYPQCESLANGGVGEGAGMSRDLSRGEALVDRSLGQDLRPVSRRSGVSGATGTITTVTQRRTRKAATPKHEKAQWKRFVRTFAKQIGAFFIIIGLFQLMRKMFLMASFSSSPISSFETEMAFSGLEGRIVEVDGLFKTTMNTMQVQVELLDKTLEREVKAVRPAMRLWLDLLVFVALQSLYLCYVHTNEIQVQFVCDYIACVVELWLHQSGFSGIAMSRLHVGLSMYRWDSLDTSESETWDGLVEEIYRDEVFQNDIGTEVLVPLYLHYRISFEHIGFHATFCEKKFSHKLLHTIRNKEKSNMKLDNNGSSGRLASKATLRKASSNSLLLYFLLVYGAYSCVCNNCVSIILYVFVITLLD